MKLTSVLDNHVDLSWKVINSFHRGEEVDGGEGEGRAEGGEQGEPGSLERLVDSQREAESVVSVPDLEVRCSAVTCPQ